MYHPPPQLDIWLAVIRPYSHIFSDAYLSCKLQQVLTATTNLVTNVILAWIRGEEGKKEGAQKHKMENLKDIWKQN